MGRKSKPKPTGTQRGRALSPVKREQVRQTFMITGNKRETARLCNIGERTVYNVLNEPEEPEAIKAREKAALQLSGKVHIKANQVLDSITEDDFQSGYLKDEDGNLVFDRQGRPIWMGPNLNQKVLSAAILADKLPVLDSYRKQIDGQEQMGELPAPETIGALVSGIKGKLKRLKMIDVQFESGNNETVERAQELLNQAQRELEIKQEVEDAHFVESVDDLHNPGRTHEEAAVQDPGAPGVQHEDDEGVSSGEGG